MSIFTMSLETLGTHHIEALNVASDFEKKKVASQMPYIKETSKQYLENQQLNDQVRMLEAEVDRLNVIVDALIKAIKVIERG